MDSQLPPSHLPRTLPPPSPVQPRAGRHPPLFTTAPADFHRGRVPMHLTMGTENSAASTSDNQPLAASLHSQSPSYGQSTVSSSSSYHFAGPSYSDQSKRRRGRQATACRECNRRKQKCDGETPCATCVKRGMQDACVYPEGSDTSWNAQGELTREVPEPKKSKKTRMSHNAPYELTGSRMRPNSDSGMDFVHDRRMIMNFDERVRGSSVPGVAIDHMGDTMGESMGESNTTPRPLLPSQSSEYSYPSITSHPISSERNKPMQVATTSASSTSHQPSSPSRSPEASLGNRFWRSHTDIRVDHTSRGNASASKGSGSSSESEHLMEENEAQGVGSMRVHSGPWTGGKAEKTFFGTSHFGPQLAARIIRSTPSVPLSDVRHAPSHGASRLDGVKPYTLESQTRDLVSHLPPRDECDRYVRRFFERYNSHNDIVYRSDFMVAYHTFWNDYNTKETSEVDLRHLSLLLIMLAFGVLLDHDPSEKGQRMEKIRGMNLPQSQSATISAMLQTLEDRTMSLLEREEKSSKWSWAAKRALMESSSFFGESIDTVRAGLLIALYLNVCRRVPEAWSAIGTAIRAAQAQGLHVDGSSWKGMSIKEAELRRRLWAQLYIVDRSISLFLGRPVCIQDGQFSTREPANMHDEELDMPSVFPRAVNLPTKTTFLILHYRLAKIIGQVQLTCFNLNPRKYADVRACEESFLTFKNSLPPHFKLDREGTETSLDDREGYQWLSTQRQTLNSKYHLARISLHRPYLLRSLGRGKGNKSNPYVESREALLFSAIADLQLRIHFNELDPLDRFKWMTVASGFNSATILGIVCHLGYRDPRFPPGQLRALLQEYISLEEKTIRRDEALETELALLRLMEKKALTREETDLRFHHQQRSAPTVSSALASGGYTAETQAHQEAPSDDGGPPVHSGRSQALEFHRSTSGLPFEGQSHPEEDRQLHQQSRSQYSSLHYPQYYPSHQAYQAHHHSFRSMTDPSQTSRNGSSLLLSTEAVPGSWTVPQQSETNPMSSSQDQDFDQDRRATRPFTVVTPDSSRTLIQTHEPESGAMPPLSSVTQGSLIEPPPSTASTATATVPGPSGYAHSTHESTSISISVGTGIGGMSHLGNNQEWLLPSDWDPTASGLPDSSDPRAWQTLLGMDWSLTDLESGEAAVVGPDGVWRNVTYVDESG